MTDTPLATGSLWFLIGVAFENVSREHPDADGNTLLSMALAQTIRSILAASDEEVLRFLLAEIAEALGNPKAQLRLTLNSAKRGRIVSPIARHEYDSDALHIAEFIWRELQLSGQMESALAGAQARYNLSRSTLFARLKAAALRNLDYQRQKWLGAQLWLELKTGLPSSTQMVPPILESDNFDKWLNRYLDEPPTDEG